jgi:hypothetical protein
MFLIKLKYLEYIISNIKFLIIVKYLIVSIIMFLIKFLADLQYHPISNYSQVSDSYLVSIGRYYVHYLVP